MGEKFWVRLWRRECERRDFFESTTKAQGIVIVLLVGALVLALAR